MDVRGVNTLSSLGSAYEIESVGSRIGSGGSGCSIGCYISGEGGLGAGSYSVS